WAKPASPHQKHPPANVAKPCLAAGDAGGLWAKAFGAAGLSAKAPSAATHKTRIRLKNLSMTVPQLLARFNWRSLAFFIAQGGRDRHSIAVTFTRARRAHRPHACATLPCI